MEEDLTHKYMYLIEKDRESSEDCKMGNAADTERWRYNNYRLEIYIGVHHMTCPYTYARNAAAQGHACVMVTCRAYQFKKCSIHQSDNVL